MIKIVLSVIALALGILTAFSLDLSIAWTVVASAGLWIAYMAAFVVLFFLFIFLVTLPVNKKKEVHKFNKTYRNILAFACDLILALFGVKVKVIGADKVTVPDGNIIITCNHRSNLDSLIVDKFFRKKPLIFYAKRSLFKIPLVGKLIHKTGYISLERDNPRKDYMAITKGIDWLTNQDVSVGLFPEGTRSKTLDVLDFKEGCLHLATKTHLPIVVSCLSGTEKVNDGLLFKRHKVTYKIIDCLYYDDYKDLSKAELAKLLRSKIVSSLNELEGRSAK